MKEKYDELFLGLERFEQPSTLLWRSIEVGVVKKKLKGIRWKGKKILDLGCGEGLITEILFGKKRVEWGLDNDKGMVKKAKKAGVYKKVVFGIGEKIPLKKGEVEMVFSNSVFEHIKDLDSVFSELKRVLVKNGLVLFTVPSDRSKRYSLLSKIGFGKIYGEWRERKFEHYNSWSLSEWKKFLGKYGFEVVDYEYYLDKEGTEFWDLLLWLFWGLGFLDKDISSWVYKRFFRERIYRSYKKAKKTGVEGAGICIVAKKGAKR